MGLKIWGVLGKLFWDGGNQREDIKAIWAPSKRHLSVHTIAECWEYCLSFHWGKKNKVNDTESKPIIIHKSIYIFGVQNVAFIIVNGDDTSTALLGSNPESFTDSYLKRDF